MPETFSERAEKSRDLPLVKLLPNLVTLAAVCAGMTAIRFGFEGRYEAAVGLILLAGMLDGIDGRLARLLRCQTQVGAELDSLADFLNFGVAPGLVLFAWSIHEMGGLGWIAVLCLALCCLLRLARFNVGSKSGEGSSTHFVGVPSPAGAVLALLPMIVSFLFHAGPIMPAWVNALWAVAMGMMMISRVPTQSFKNMRVSRDNAHFFLLGAVLLAAGLLIFPWATLTFLSLLYLCGILWAVRSSMKSRHEG